MFSAAFSLAFSHWSVKKSLRASQCVHIHLTTWCRENQESVMAWEVYGVQRHRTPETLLAVQHAWRCFWKSRNSFHVSCPLGPSEPLFLTPSGHCNSDRKPLSHFQQWVSTVSWTWAPTPKLSGIVALSVFSSYALLCLRPCCQALHVFLLASPPFSILIFSLNSNLTEGTH